MEFRKIVGCVAVVAAAVLISEKGEAVMLEWMGKAKVINHHNEVPFHVLERKYSFDGEGQHAEDNGSENMIIHGDNLLALKSLLPRYEGRVKCIYIDPPYNTGNEGWCYNDNVNDPQIKAWLGKVVGKEGEDFSRHDKWLCMMYPRLKLLQKLLSEDGAIFISIDDNEQANLKLVCDEIFGARNFLATFVWQKRYSRENREAIGDSHEYVVSYGKNPERFKQSRNLLPLSEKQKKLFKNPDKDQRGPWQSVSMLAQGYRPNQMYDIVAPNGTVHTPPEGRCWCIIKSEYEKLLNDGRISFGADGNGVPRKKVFLAEAKGLVPWTWLPHEDVGHTDEAKKEQKVIFDGHIPFDTPKPVRLLEYFVQIAADKDSVILDSFAGSGTTAHAVLNANKQDGGNRKFILVEMMDYADSVTAERVKRVIQGYGSGDKAVEGTGGSFGFYELGAELMENGVLNEDVGEAAIREYVWYTETKGAGEFWDKAKVKGEGEQRKDSYLLGTAFGVAYYFCYEKGEAVTLNRALLKKIKTKAESYVVYADACTLSEDELEKYHIVFKKIPRDVTRF